MVKFADSDKERPLTRMSLNVDQVNEHSSPVPSQPIASNSNGSRNGYTSTIPITSPNGSPIVSQCTATTSVYQNIHPVNLTGNQPTLAMLPGIVGAGGGGVSMSGVGIPPMALAPQVAVTASYEQLLAMATASVSQNTVGQALNQTAYFPAHYLQVNAFALYSRIVFYFTTNNDH